MPRHLKSSGVNQVSAPNLKAVAGQTQSNSGQTKPSPQDDIEVKTPFSPVKTKQPIPATIPANRAPQNRGRPAPTNPYSNTNPQANPPPPNQAIIDDVNHSIENMKNNALNDAKDFGVHKKVFDEETPTRTNLRKNS